MPLNVADRTGDAIEFNEDFNAVFPRRSEAIVKEIRR